LNFIFTRRFLERCFHEEGIVDALVHRPAKPCELVSDEDRRFIMDCSFGTSKPGKANREAFFEKFKSIKEAWSHPVCRIIDRLTKDSSFWTAEHGALEGSYQATLLGPIITAIIGNMPVNQHL
jgi:hypothetical protein